jgi:glycerol-3-phosphate acyltransferase PlsY
VISQLKNLSDPRKSGSGNAGATNMLRLYGRSIAVLTLLGDISKGFLVVWLYQRWAVSNNYENVDIALVALAAIAGHIYPVFFSFKGGKGVATMLGVMLATSVYLALFTLGCWLIGLLATRVSGYAALLTAAISPIAAWLLKDDFAFLWFTCSIVLFLTHKTHVTRLLKQSQP